MLAIGLSTASRPPFLPPVVTAAASWEVVNAEDGLVVQARSRPGSPIRTLRAEGVVRAPPHAVRAVIADLERYPEFMPYVKESRILAREPDGAVLVYQRLSFGALRLFVDDRDYVIRIREQSWRTPAGAPVYQRSWSIVTTGPAPAGPSVVRLTTNDGAWELAAEDTGTRAVYCLFTDPGGSVPPWLANQANRAAIPDLFAAIRQAATDPRYAAVPPEPPAATARPADARTPCDD